MTAITLQGGFVYGYLTTEEVAFSLMVNGIVKLTMNEGKLLWSKTLNLYNPIHPDVNLYISSARYLGADPLSTERMVLSMLV